MTCRCMCRSERAPSSLIDDADDESDDVELHVEESSDKSSLSESPVLRAGESTWRQRCRAVRDLSV